MIEREQMFAFRRWKMSTAKDEREKALEAAMAQIQKQFGKGAIMKLGEGAAQMNIETVSTGSILSLIHI